MLSAFLEKKKLVERNLGPCECIRYEIRKGHIMLYNDYYDEIVLEKDIEKAFENVTGYGNFWRELEKYRVDIPDWWN